MTQKYNSRDAEVEPRVEETEWAQLPMRKIELDAKGDMVEGAFNEASEGIAEKLDKVVGEIVEAQMVEDGREDGTSGVEI